MNLCENDFKNLNPERDSEVLDLVRQKVFYHYEYMCDFEEFKEKLPDKNEFHSSLSDKGISGKEYQHAPKVWKKIEMKMMKDYHHLHLKCNVCC